MRLISNLNLGDNKNGQSIYTSQLYGTFFGIYAKVNARDNDQKDYWTLDAMELKIMNYKGIVNLGITQAKLIESKHDGIHNNDARLYVEVQACYNMPDEFIKVENSSGQKFTKGKANIRLERFLKPMHAHSNGVKQQLNDGVFDEEFFYREGKLYDNELAERKKHAPVQWEDKKVEKPVGEEEGIITSGWMCPYADIIVTFFEILL